MVAPLYAYPESRVSLSQMGSFDEMGKLDLLKREAVLNSLVLQFPPDIILIRPQNLNLKPT
jgi:hypothetical protein